MCTSWTSLDQTTPKLRVLSLLKGVFGSFKVVICGKYKNLDKITKIQHISLKFYRLLIFVILYSLQYKIEGHAV